MMKKLNKETLEAIKARLRKLIKDKKEDKGLATHGDLNKNHSTVSCSHLFDYTTEVAEWVNGVYIVFEDGSKQLIIFKEQKEG